MMPILRLKSDKLIASSLHLSFASGITAMLGLIFWVLVSRLFPPSAVGLASSLISSMALVATISALGFDVSLVRLWNRRKALQLTASSLALVSVASLLAASGFALFFLVTGRINAVQCCLFVLFSIGWALFLHIDSLYLAQRRTKAILIKQTLFGLLKLCLPLLLLGFGFIAIFLSYTGAAVIALLLCLPFYRLPLGWRFDWQLMASMFTYSSLNFLSSVISRARELVLPLLVVYLRGPSETAYFYQAFSITLVFMLVPKAVSKALLAEASRHVSKEAKLFRKAILLTLLVSVTGLVLSLLLGRSILSLYGAAYADNGATLFYLFALAGLPMGCTEIIYARWRVRSKMAPLLTLQSINLVITLGLCVVLAPLSLAGVAIAWLASESVICLAAVLLNWRLR